VLETSKLLLGNSSVVQIGNYIKDAYFFFMMLKQMYQKNCICHSHSYNPYCRLLFVRKQIEYVRLSMSD